jgi:hypothetical protein
MSEENLDQNSGNQDPVEVDWKSSITDDGLKAHASMDKFKTTQDLFKSYVNLEKLVGKEKLPVPTDKDGKEVWDMVFSRLGRPDTSKGYKLPELQKPDGFPEGDPKELEGILNKAHELGLNNKQIGELYQSFMEGEIAKYNQFTEAKETSRINAEKELRKEWGKAYEEKMNRVKGVLSKFADPDVMKMVEEGLGNDPRFIRFLGKVSSKLSEDGISGKPSGFAMSPEEANAEISRIKGEALGNPKHPLLNKEHPEHDAVVQRMNKLFGFASAESS